MTGTYRQHLRDLVVDGVRTAVGSAERCAVLMYRDAPNVGDAAIWMAQKSVLAELGVEVAYAEAGRFFDPAKLARRLPEGPILISGGGSMGTTWMRSQVFKQRIIQSYPDRRVVILPQSANFSTPESLEEFVKLAAAHPDLRILARDSSTFELLSSLLEGVELVPDMVFALEHPRLDHASPSPTIPDGSRVLWLLREDAEAAGTPMVVSHGTRADWADPPLVHLLLEADKLLARTRIDSLRRTRFAEWKAERRVDAGLALLAGHDAVVTDRLHGAVLSFLLGTPCVVMDNSWGKVHRFCRTWFHERDDVVIATDASDVHQALERLVAP